MIYFLWFIASLIAFPNLIFLIFQLQLPSSMLPKLEEFSKGKSATLDHFSELFSLIAASQVCFLHCANNQKLLIMKLSPKLTINVFFFSSRKQKCFPRSISH